MSQGVQETCLKPVFVKSVVVGTFDLGDLACELREPDRESLILR